MPIVSTLFRWIQAHYQPPQEVMYPNKVAIPFIIQDQEMDNWCWAAAATSVVYYFDDQTGWTQTDVVAETYNFPPGDQPDQSWDLTGSLENALALVGCLGSTQLGHASFRRISRELVDGNPVAVHIDWGGGLGHAIVISGCWEDDMNRRHYYINDPSPHHTGDLDEQLGRIKIPERRLISGYHQIGTWKTTYFVA